MPHRLPTYSGGNYGDTGGLVGRKLWLRATDTTVTVFCEHHLVASHLRAKSIGTRRTVQEHLPPNAQLYFAHDRHWCSEQARTIGPACTQLVDQLLSDRVVERLRAAQGVLHLVDRFGATRLEAACARAVAHDSPYYRTVKTILVGGFDLRPPEARETLTVYVQEPLFVRPARDLFSGASSLNSQEHQP